MNALLPRSGPPGHVQIGVLSWNVGGISDHRKDQGAGLEEVGCPQSLPPSALSTRARKRRQLLQMFCKLRPQTQHAAEVSAVVEQAPNHFPTWAVGMFMSAVTKQFKIFGQIWQEFCRETWQLARPA